MPGSVETSDWQRPVSPNARMKILILGGRGRLAAALSREWSLTHEVVSVARHDVDVADLGALEAFLGAQTFDVLVNGTGMTNVDLCETERDQATAVNATAPGVMAAAAERKSARLIHFSTDYVFDGNKKVPYVEGDPISPLGWYGQTKADGEAAVLAVGGGHLVVRVSWVFGPDKPSFIDLIVERAQTNTDVSAVADKFSSPTYARDVAAWLEPFFEPGIAGGMIHACNSGICSWQEYGQFALKCAAEAGLPLATTDVKPVFLADMKSFAAPRPVFTPLSTARLTQLTGITPRAWQEAVRDYIFTKHIPA